MKKFWITYSDTWKDCPLAFWVHKPLEEGEFYEETTEFNPEGPKKHIQGYPVYNFELDGFVFVFSSIEQIEHFVKILSIKVLPTTRKLSEQRGGKLGPNRHWLSRLPAKTKSYKYRQKLVSFIKSEFPDT